MPPANVGSAPTAPCCKLGLFGLPLATLWCFHAQAPRVVVLLTLLTAAGNGAVMQMVPPLLTTHERFLRCCGQHPHARILDQMKRKQQSDRTWKDGLVAAEPIVKKWVGPVAGGLSHCYCPQYRADGKPTALECPPFSEESGPKGGKCLPWASQDVAPATLPDPQGDAAAAPWSRRLLTWGNSLAFLAKVGC